MSKTPSIILILFFTLTASLFLLTSDRKDKGDVEGLQKSYDIQISAMVGNGARFSLFGYSSPMASIKLESKGLFLQTYANNEGYFAFEREFAPLISQDICLTAQDQFGRVSPPLCLPPLPENYNVNIGPVIMPPTTSLSKENYFVGDDVVLSGQTLPNTTVDLTMFTRSSLASEGFSSYFRSFFKVPSLIGPVEAYSFPEMKAHTDKKGNFSISLPSASVQKYRLFTQSSYSSFISPKSNTLSLEILPVWMIILYIIGLIISFIRPYLLEILILLQLAVIAWILYKKFFDPHRLHALMIQPNEELAIVESHQIAPYEEYY